MVFMCLYHYYSNNFLPVLVLAMSAGDLLYNNGGGGGGGVNQEVTQPLVYLQCTVVHPNFYCWFTSATP